MHSLYVYFNVPSRPSSFSYMINTFCACSFFCSHYSFRNVLLLTPSAHRRSSNSHEYSFYLSLDFCPTYLAYFSSPVTPEPGEEDDDPEAEASSPDFERALK